MVVFDVDEVFGLAIRIEENGEKFYRHAAVVTEDETARYLFNHLADEELKHKEVFKDMISRMKVECKDRPESYPGEYMDYLRNYLDDNIVFNKKAESEFAQIRDTIDAVNFAIDRETDSILYYSEIKQLVPQSGHALVDEIIAEERRHFLKLAEFKKDYLKRNP